MKEYALHGFWNGSLPPMGYRIVEAAEQPRRTKKTLVGLIFPLAREVDDSSRPMGVSIWGSGVRISSGAPLKSKT